MIMMVYSQNSVPPNISAGSVCMCYWYVYIEAINPFPLLRDPLLGPLKVQKTRRGSSMVDIICPLPLGWNIMVTDLPTRPPAPRFQRP